MPKKPEDIAAEQAAAKAAADKAAADKAAADAANGFPSDTPIEQMTADQQVAYWKHKARKHENENKSKADYDQLKADSDELAKLKLASASDQDKAVAEAAEKARREGEAIGADRYLKEAVKARFQALTGKSDEEVEAAFGHVDAGSFRDDKGEIDLEALKTFAAAFGTSQTTTTTTTDPVREAMERRGGGSGGTGSGSIAEMKEARKEKLAGKK